MKRYKLFMSISMTCFVVAAIFIVLCFTVFNLSGNQYKIGCAVTYNVDEASASVTTRVYTSDTGDKENLAAMVNTLASTGDFSALKDTNYKYDFITTGNGSEEYSNLTQLDGNTKGGIDIKYNSTDKRTYIVVFSIKNNGESAICASLTENELSSEANTYFVKSEPIESITSDESEKKTCHSIYA